jgi:hypothetical protein
VPDEECAEMPPSEEMSGLEEFMQLLEHQGPLSPRLVLQLPVDQN